MLLAGVMDLNLNLPNIIVVKELFIILAKHVLADCYIMTSILYSLVQVVDGPVKHLM